jgi:cation transport protein ChaC
MLLRRELLVPEYSERIEQALRALGADVVPTEARAASLQATLERVAEGSDVWVFGYGSLMWNPAIHHAETRAARARGWHRSFCLWNSFGRGSAENPGLTLALEPGGSCAGLALRIAASQVESELGVLWNREMITGAYAPRWLRLRTDAGEIEAVTFIANRASRRYAGRLPLPQLAERMARAAGPLGTSREYLESTVAELERLGARDGSMHALLRAVRTIG